jgi:thymidylate kinase
MAKFIVFEGTDCSGKTTSVNILIDYLNSKNIPNIYIKLPDRSGVHGGIIDKYLKKEIELTNEHAYILFKENRFPYANDIKHLLNKGITVICDRYLYSGIVYSYYNTNSDTLNNSSITDELIKFKNDDNVASMIINEDYMPMPDIIFLIDGLHPRYDTLERYEDITTINIIFSLFKSLYEVINVNYHIINNRSELKHTRHQLIEHWKSLF